MTGGVMGAPGQFQIADFGGETEDVQNAAGNPLHKMVSLQWCRPRQWRKGEAAPIHDEDEPCVYALVRNHGNARSKDNIVYIGLTKNPQTRFANHPTAKRIVKMRGEVGLSLAPINFVKGRNRIQNLKRALEEIEHLLIWSLWQGLENDRKMFTLPGMSRNAGNAWHIVNEGYRFSGRMPREIIYPWMLVKPGRNRTAKKA